jgi:hypothetical protein
VERVCDVRSLKFFFLPQSSRHWSVNPAEVVARSVFMFAMCWIRDEKGKCAFIDFLDILNAEELRENPTYTLESSTRSRNNKSRRGSFFI